MLEDQQTQLAHYQKTIKTLQDELQANEKIMHLMNEDIILKNRLVN
jgi:hypothetical protein